MIASRGCSDFRSICSLSIRRLGLEEQYSVCLITGRISFALARVLLALDVADVGHSCLLGLGGAIGQQRL